MILEGIVTTINADGTVNISPMGPIVDAALTRLELRPFQTSTTFQNLRRTGRACFTSPTTWNCWPARRSAGWKRRRG